MRRSFTAAMPRASVLTVVVVTRVRAVSLVTNVTGPGVWGAVMANTTARSGRGVMEPVAPDVSPTSTLKESESESGGTAETCTVSASGAAARSVSATATPRNRTTNVSGKPGTVVPTARRALATTTTLSGIVSGASRRTFTKAMPETLETAVTVSASACAVSCVTSVTGPAAEGWTRVYTTGRPASGTIGLAAAVTVSAISIVSESDNESSAVGPAMSTVSSVGPANTVSAAASVRIARGLETRPPPFATSRPVPPGWTTTVRPVVLSSTAIVVSGENQNTAVAAESPRPVSTRAVGLSVSYSSRLSGAVTSSAMSRERSVLTLQVAAAASTRTRTPTLREPPPRRPGSAPRRLPPGRAAPGWRARSIFARPAPWGGG